MLEIIKELILGLKDKGLKWILSILFLIMALSLFISPTFTFILLFNSDFLKTNILELITVILIFSCILFIFIYFMISGTLAVFVLKMRLSNKVKIVDKSNTYEYIILSVVISLLNMGAISLILLCGSTLYNFSIYKARLKLGIILFLIAIIIILLIGSISWVYLLYRVRYKKKLSPEKILEELEKQKEIEKVLNETDY